MRIIRTAVLFVAFFAGTVVRAETRMGGVAGNTTTTDWSTGVSYEYSGINFTPVSRLWTARGIDPKVWEDHVANSVLLWLTTDF